MKLKKNLDNIFILGRGQSLVKCPVEKPKNTEYWGCNNTYKARNIDRLFIMHDLYLTQYNKDKQLIETVNEKGFPVYTLGKYGELKNNIQYPIKEMINEFNTGFFLTNISYMLALAIMQKPKNIYMFGVDMMFNTSTEYMRNEKGSVEFWCGVAIGRKIKVYLQEESALMKRKRRNNFYGMKQEIDKNTKTIKLIPEYMWGRQKCAAEYKMVKSTLSM